MHIWLPVGTLQTQGRVRKRKIVDGTGVAMVVCMYMHVHVPTGTATVAVAFKRKARHAHVHMHKGARMKAMQNSLKFISNRQRCTYYFCMLRFRHEEVQVWRSRRCHQEVCINTVWFPYTHNCMHSET